LAIAVICFSPLFAEPTCCYGHTKGDVLKTRKMRG
jgi:hypothetical protein